MEFELLNKNVPVLTFSYDPDLHAVRNVLELENPDFAPVSIVSSAHKVSSESLRSWWSKRGIPASRDQLDRLLDALDIDQASRLVLLERNFGLSLSDRYWVRPVGSGYCWDDVNFFDNDFTGSLGQLTLEAPVNPDSVDTGSIDLMDPNSTVGGNLQKKWMIADDGTRVLVKSGSAHFRQDVFNEVVATSLYAHVLERDQFVPYSITWSQGVPYCCCPNMLGEDEELVTAADILAMHHKEAGYGSYPHMKRTMIATTGIDEDALSGWLSQMFSCDFVLANVDRHTGNLGFIRDCTTLEYKRPAPIYDTGMSLWCTSYRLSNPIDYEYNPRPFTGGPSESRYQQLKLFDDYRWLHEDDLSGWLVEARGILSQNEMMPASRIDAVIDGLTHNIESFYSHVDRMARLFPEHAPTWI